MSKVITDEAVQMGFDYLNQNSEEIAMARANQIRADYRAKRVFARLFRSTEGSVEMRKAWAMCHDDYAEAMENVALAEQVWERCRDQRNRAELIIEAWRSQMASQRAIERIR